MTKRTVKIVAWVLLILLIFTGCGKQTLDEMLADNVSALEEIRSKDTRIVCRDYTIYSIGNGIDDSTNATRYASGLVETTDRFVSYPYIVEDNKTGWKYIFEDMDDIPIWASCN